MTDERLKRCCEVSATIHSLDAGIKSLSHNVGSAYIEICSEVNKEFLTFIKQLREKYQKQFDEL